MSFSSDERTALIIAAAGAAGDPSQPGWSQRLEAAAVAIAVEASPASRLSKKLEKLGDSKVIYGILRSVQREESSTRAVLTLQGRPSKFHEDGLEQARSERTDQADGLAFAKKAADLVGHRVLVWVYLETIGDGDVKIRVAQHVVDLGVAE